MTKTKHTPEPWEFELSWSCYECKFFDINKKGTSFGEKGHHIAGADNKEDLKRIVSCVNALAGIPDPEEFVKAAKELLSESRDALSALLIASSAFVANRKESLALEMGASADALQKFITRAEDAFGKTRKEEI